MKQYLSAREMNDLLFVCHLMEINSTMVDEWDKRGNLTKTERKYLRTSLTYTEKFVKEVLSRMPEKEVDKFMKRTIKAQKEPIRIIDSWMEKRVLGTYDTEYEIVKIERPSFEELAFVAVSNTCKDCTKSFNDCDFYNILEDNLVPRCELRTNCPYAHESKEKRLERERLEEEKRLAKESKSKRKKKKLANRYDEDVEESYVYNTK